MSKKKRFGVSQALTRGLSETIHVVENNAGTFRNVILPLSRIELDPDNPRKLMLSLADVQNGVEKSDPLYERKMTEIEKLRELANTIETSGIINPIVVYKAGESYRVVAGERRSLASILAGRQEIDARVFNEKPRGFELKLLQWVENTAREDLTLDERIGNIRDIIHEYQVQHNITHLSATLLKNITGLSLPQASYYMAVLNAPHDLKDAIEHGKIASLDKAAVIAGIESDSLRTRALLACIEGCSLKELRQIITKEKQIEKKQAILQAANKRGRSVSRINMGFTLNTRVVEAIVTCVLAQPEFKKYADVFSKVNWDHFDQTARAFQKLIEILEHETVR
ncbi:MAG TPA: ParB/RepB/Spo0J family partition protein [Gammaproteobacteria bacterium]|nr:ParB/RepB/Spo0J family partition protein [Gammaproteobacteria bacterium]